MEKTDDRGPALPRSLGETLVMRAVYSGLALQGIIAAHADSEAALPRPEYAAQLAVNYADALLLELEKGGGQ